MKKKPKKKITQLDLIRSVRRTMPPPVVTIESKKEREARRPKHKKRLPED